MSLQYILLLSSYFSAAPLSSLDGFLQTDCIHSLVPTLVSNAKALQFISDDLSKMS